MYSACANSEWYDESSAKCKDVYDIFHASPQQFVQNGLGAEYYIGKGVCLSNSNVLKMDKLLLASALLLLWICNYLYIN
jgi:hypothetical protein